MIELDPDSPEFLDLYDGPPPTREEIAEMADQDALDEIHDREAAAELVWEAFLSGVRGSASISPVVLGPADPAFDLGSEIGWVLRGRIALDPSLAPILDALTKEPT